MGWFDRLKQGTSLLSISLQQNGLSDRLLEEKLSNKNEVISELMEEQIKAKKALGDA